MVKADVEVAEENARLRHHLAMKKQRYREQDFVERRQCFNDMADALTKFFDLEGSDRPLSRRDIHHADQDKKVKPCYRALRAFYRRYLMSADGLARLRYLPEHGAASDTTRGRDGGNN